MKLAKVPEHKPIPTSETRVLKWVGGGLEAALGIPIIGGLFIISLNWMPLLIMLAFHIVALILTIQAGRKRTGHILGIIASAVGWIPLIGMIMHIITATFLMIEAGQDE
ncbi:hypothetical protein [Planococcus lenghuensis]|uniref:Uncharacterized protein n=1 Tax=Planococcus lenghuensis TaxID=2213202 RepID=A0A1Q2KZL5_9BACL|nr:hypothetical protein [Planococcus lenghuensis]AQQ53082.1 hypothetical protein B0X71_08230 [Planococcus lenghuensis]